MSRLLRLLFLMRGLSPPFTLIWLRRNSFQSTISSMLDTSRLPIWSKRPLTMEWTRLGSYPQDSLVSSRNRLRSHALLHQLGDRDSDLSARSDQFELDIGPRRWQIAHQGKIFAIRDCKRCPSQTDVGREQPGAP